jgi:hypothetical protein
VGTSQLGAEQYRDAALDIAGQVFRRNVSTPTAYPYLRNCAPASAADPCVATFIRAVGMRLFRRPVTDDEVQRYGKIIGSDGTTPDKLALSLQYALGAMLASPSFLYVVQVGEKEPATGALRFSGYEMASRLAYTIWDSTPDPELLDAAGKGQLLTPEGLTAQVRRMLEMPRARSLPVRYFGESWKVAKLGVDDKSTTVYPLWTDAVLRGYRGEFARLLEDKVFDRPGDLRGLFDARETFVNSAIGKVYKTPTTSTDFVKMALDQNRAGVLTTGAVISANSPGERSSPTYRGVFVRERVLCQEIPPPPPDVNDELPAGQAAGTTLREQLEQHRRNPACAGCHSIIDPIGLTFENFDGIGAYRTMDNGQLIDSAGELDGAPFNSVREMATALRNDPRTASCIAEQLYDFATGHRHTAGEAGVVAALSDGFAAQGHDFKNLIAGVATSVGFRYLAPIN